MKRSDQDDYDSSGYGYGGYPAYVSVAERRKKAEKAIARAKKNGTLYTPVAPMTGGIAKTAWGKAWCSNLERYSDYATRLPRGRSYLRQGAVVDLQLSAGEVRAKVLGSSLYNVKISVASVPVPYWHALCRDCAGSIDSLVELLQGKLSKPVMERICQPSTGLFPEPREIRFSCSCPDHADMCKHVAAVLYGIGARLDAQPELLFTLRKVDATDLVAQATSGLASGGGHLASSGGPPAGDQRLEESSLADLFGLDMADTSAVVAASSVVVKSKFKDKARVEGKVKPEPKVKVVALSVLASPQKVTKPPAKKAVKKPAHSPASKLKALLAEAAALQEAIDRHKKSEAKS